MIDRTDALWYKNAVIYQLHIKAFYDANGDGIGDFAGLMEKLDHVQELGVNVIWLLPFYPSPLRDDGYDIADYRDVNPNYGSMADFRAFVQAAHDRGIRVITELVINHTSDQHPWFQRARHSAPGSPERDYYVWSDTDQKYQETRIIFLDTESSNWTWDPVAKQYFWHRFYSHQPDLNFDNPAVLNEVLDVMRYWLDMGVDGLRLDAIPYLIERDGTNNENLPETHVVLKKIRAALDEGYSDRMLLAEANQWPEDVQQYFGDGDECHMSFHFPLMPRMYMAVAQEDRHPVTDIMRQTPEIPENCQWAIFLRNHDELTLEMVSSEERDYMWNFYAADKRARINLGIRRRLSPLLEHDRRRIELLNSMLLSMPGTPVLYYGDEIGMGDNIYLGDRDGVRTPMQWSIDRNGGFSKADPARLYLPAIQDSLYGFQAVNVEAQQRDPSSLLNWMKRIIAVRKSLDFFGTGTLRFIYPGNRKILAYLREQGDQAVLCVVNLSRAAQPVELELAEFKGRMPIELLGRTPFPPVGDLPYMLTLAPYGFYWFNLTAEADLPKWHNPLPEPLPEFTTLVMSASWKSVVTGREAHALERQVLPKFLPNQRWFAGKNARVASARVADWAELPGGNGGYLLTQVAVKSAGSEDERRYLLPLAASFEAGAGAGGSALLPYMLAKVRRVAQIGALYDCSTDDTFPLVFAHAMKQGMEAKASTGKLKLWGTSHLAALDLPEEIGTRRSGAEQSNSSTLIGDTAVLKILRQLQPGIHPELEISHFLTEVANFKNTPPLLGAAEWTDDGGEPTTVAVMQGFVYNQGDAWTYTLDYLMRELGEVRLVGGGAEELTIDERHGFYLSQAKTLGRRTGELHCAFAGNTDLPDFRPEPIDEGDLSRWRDSIRREAVKAFAAIERAKSGLTESVVADADAALGAREEILARVNELCLRPLGAMKTRLHGDYHLGQVLVSQQDFYIIDFEGEPARSIEERRAKTSPLKDVAGMLRSFDYATWAAILRLSETGELPETAREHALAWRDRVCQSFLDGYIEAASGSAAWPEEAGAGRRLVDLFAIEKALYEISYEAANRPAWLGIPIKGLLAIVGAGEPAGGASHG